MKLRYDYMQNHFAKYLVENTELSVNLTLR